MESLHQSFLIILMVFTTGYFILDGIIVAASSVRFRIYYTAFCLIAVSMVWLVLR
jgi:hypothetical protein